MIIRLLSHTPWCNCPFLCSHISIVNASETRSSMSVFIWLLYRTRKSWLRLFPLRGLSLLEPTPLSRPEHSVRMAQQIWDHLLHSLNFRRCCPGMAYPCIWKWVVAEAQTWSLLSTWSHDLVLFALNKSEGLRWNWFEYEELTTYQILFKSSPRLILQYQGHLAQALLFASAGQPGNMKRKCRQWPACTTKQCELEQPYLQYLHVLVQCLVNAWYPIILWRGQESLCVLDCILSGWIGKICNLENGIRKRQLIMIKLSAHTLYSYSLATCDQKKGNISKGLL